MVNTQNANYTRTTPSRFLDGGYLIYPRGNQAASITFNTAMESNPIVNIKDNYNRTMLKTFGKFPSIYYVGETLFKTFQLQTVFTTDENIYDYINVDSGDSFGTYDTQGEANQQNELCNGITDPFNHCIDSMFLLESNGGPTITAKHKLDSFMSWINKRVQWCVRGAIAGEDFICDIEVVDISHPQNSTIRKGGTNQQSGRNVCDDVFYMDYISITISCTEIATFDYSKDGSYDIFDKWDTV